MVTVYSKHDCVQCKMTKRFLDQHNVAYQEINLDEQPEFIEHVKGLGFSSAPVIETETESFSGFQPSKLKALV
ncbi:TPA: glutaredoxin-like protein NrdH [Streptococcus suis]